MAEAQTDPEVDEVDEEDHVDPPLPIGDHLRELRVRLLKSILALVLGFAVCYKFADPILAALLKPLQALLTASGRGDVIFTGITEPFIVQLKAAFVAAFFLVLPYLCVQLYGFLKPAFRGVEKKYFVWLFFMGGVLFAIGATFGYLGVMPYGIKFLVGLAGSNLLPQISINEYFSFAVKLLFAFGLVFELPLAVLLLARLGLVDRYFFARNRRYAVVITFVAAAILTPPDVLTQTMLAVPLLVLYEVSAQIAKVVGVRDFVEDDDDDDDDEAEEDAKKGKKKG